MSAIVEGVSMVRHCGECELNKLNWDRCHQILRGCPIIGEMPDKHGDLVDKDEVKEMLLKYGFHTPDMTVTEFVEDCLTAIVERR